MQESSTSNLKVKWKHEHTVESGYLVHMPEESTTATCALGNEIRGSASSILPTLLSIMKSLDLDLELTVYDHCMHYDINSYMHAIVAMYVPVLGILLSDN